MTATNATIYTPLETEMEGQRLKSTKPRSIPLDRSSQKYQRILEGPPTNPALKSGLVHLGPGESVGKHSTGRKEELIIVLEGEAELRIESGSSIRLDQDNAGYCPPDTVHDVVNTGDADLRYVFVVTETR